MVGQINPFPNKPCFLRVCSASLLKTLWEKEELLLTSNSPFSHSVFYLYGKLFFFLFSSNLKLSSANSLSLEEFRICRLGKGLYCSRQRESAGDGEGSVGIRVPATGLVDHDFKVVDGLDPKRIDSIIQMVETKNIGLDNKGY